jgi:hypothetical protein
MISTIPEGHNDHDYQTACKGKRRRISKVSMSLGHTAAEDARSEISSSIRKELSRRRSSVIAPEAQLKRRPTETANFLPSAEATESAASKALNNFDVFEHILMQLPWDGDEVDLQRQSIRAIMTTSRTCRSFKGMIDASARLQKRLFLARDSEQKRPCYCGHQEEERICGAETNPFIAPTLKKHKHAQINNLSPVTSAPPTNPRATTSATQSPSATSKTARRNTCSPSKSPKTTLSTSSANAPLQTQVGATCTSPTQHPRVLSCTTGVTSSVASHRTVNRSQRALSGILSMKLLRLRDSAKLLDINMRVMSRCLCFWARGRKRGIIDMCMTG